MPMSLYLYIYILSCTISNEKLKRLVAMENQYSLLYLSLLLSFSLLHEHVAYAAGTNDGSEHWGYVEVRPSNKAIFTCKIFFFFLTLLCQPNRILYLFVTIVVHTFVLYVQCIEAHMFWWLYRSPFRVEDPSKPWPTILWLQGGPVSY